RLTSTWSPMSSVLTMDSEGMTRACTNVPWMNRNARITHSQPRTSRSIRSRADDASGVGGFLLAATAGRHFQLHEFGGVHARIAGRAELSFGVAHRLPQVLHRQIAERVRPGILADLLHGMLRSDQLLARGRVHAVVARGNRGRATDAQVDFHCARLAHDADDF